MDLRFSPAQEAFRAEVRDWMPTTSPVRSRRSWAAPSSSHFQRRWQATLAERRLVAVHWPADFGGRGLGWIEDFIVQEEIALARAPEIVNRIAVNLVGPTLLEHGTPRPARPLPAPDRHRRRHLVPAVQRARRRLRPGVAAHDAVPASAGGWRVNGQKVWASNAQYSRYGVLLARTGAADARPSADRLLPARRCTSPASRCGPCADDGRGGVQRGVPRRRLRARRPSRRRPRRRLAR